MSLNPANKLKIPLEHDEAVKLVQWAQFVPLVWANLAKITNEGTGSPQRGIRNRQEGLKKGVSDYFLSYPRQPYHGFWIELKRASRSLSRVSIEQQEWLDSRKALGYAAEVAYGADEMIEQLKWYLGI